MKKQILKFFETQSVYRCPICSSEIKMQDNESSLVCLNNHCFDVSSKGYVNFLQNSRQSKVYNLSFFENRRRFIEYGFYSHISDEIYQTAAKIKKSGRLRIADAGCGEGSFSLSLSKKLAESPGAEAEIFAFDFSKDAVQTASKGGNNILWMVADIANIPLADKSTDVLLNIYSPANYAEFKRILKKDGILAKVIPGANHMCELRNKIHTSEIDPETEEYSNQQVVDVFKRNFEISHRYTVSKTCEISDSQMKNLLGMTPLMFGLQGKSQDLTDLSVDKITVEAEILISHAI